MPVSFFAAIRLAGLNVGLLIVVLFVLALLFVLAWRLFRMVLIAALLLVLIPVALIGRAFGLPRAPVTEEDRLAHEKIRQATEQFLGSAFRVSDGGRYGRRKRYEREMRLKRSLLG